MASQRLAEVLKQAEQLSVDEQLELIARLAEKAARQSRTMPRRSLMEFQGLVPYPMFGEDAQAWVTRTRHEADEARERQWYRTP